MNYSAYHSLINDALSYARALLPPAQELPEVPAPRSPLPVKKTLPPQAEPKPTQQKEKKVTAPTPPPQEREEEGGEKMFVTLEMQKAPTPEPTAGMCKILKELDPTLYMHESIPSDAKAKRIREAWKAKRNTPEIPLLFQGREYQSFIHSIARAIDTVYGSSSVVPITSNKKWDLFLESKNLKLVIAPDTFIFGNKELLSLYREIPQKKVRTLGEVPLLLLPDLSLYYKDPYLKRSLWNVLCTTIDSLPSS